MKICSRNLENEFPTFCTFQFEKFLLQMKKEATKTLHVSLTSLLMGLFQFPECFLIAYCILVQIHFTDGNQLNVSA